MSVHWQWTSLIQTSNKGRNFLCTERLQLQPIPLQLVRTFDHFRTSHWSIDEPMASGRCPTRVMRMTGYPHRHRIPSDQIHQDPMLSVFLFTQYQVLLRQFRKYHNSLPDQYYNRKLLHILH